MIIKQHGGVVLMHDVKPITAKIIAGVLDDLEARTVVDSRRSSSRIVPVSLHYFLRTARHRARSRRPCRSAPTGTGRPCRRVARSASAPPSACPRSHR